jgi:hypothetical protein
MAQESVIPQKLMTAALLHFEQGVPICDCDIRTEQRERLARVSHVYMVWKQNPLLDVFGLFKQMTKQGKYADVHSAWKAARQDKMLFDFVVEHVALGNRHEDEALVRAAAKQAIRVGMETDNTTALVKGGKLLYDVAGLDKPESEKADMSKVAFLPPVVVTDISRLDDSKENIDDQEMKRIMAKYGGVVDEKMREMDEMVELMEAKSQAQQMKKEEEILPDKEE